MSFGRTAARDGNQVRFLPAAQLALPARPRPVVDGGESLIDEPSPRLATVRALTETASAVAVRQPFVVSNTFTVRARLAPAGYLNQIGPLGGVSSIEMLTG